MKTGNTTGEKGKDIDGGDGHQGSPERQSILYSERQSILLLKISNSLINYFNALLYSFP